MTDAPHGPSPLLQLTLLRIREYTREPEALFWVFAFPILVALALGIAFRSPSNPPIRVGVVASAGLETVRARLERVAGFEVREVEAARVDAALRDGEVHLMIVGAEPPVYRYDPTRAESRLARLAVDDALQRADGRADRWTAEDQQVVTPGSRYIDWLVPGLLGMNIMSTSLWGIAFSIVTTRTRKLLKRLVATPMRRRDFLLSQILGRLVFLGFEVVLLLGFAWLAFDVRIRGAIVLVAGLSLLGALSSAGLALLVSARAKTVEGVSGLLNLVMLPMWILSGVFFSTANFPDAMQPFIKALPLTALNDALRAVILEGAPAGALALDTGILAAWTVVTFGLALRWFRWL
jgi:ABC-type multidrug transport system permease subunit